MKLMTILVLISTLISAAPTVFAADYEITRNEDGPFSFTISGVKFNEGSSLQRESILFNDPTCPIQVASHSTKILYKDRGLRFDGTTRIEARSKVLAVEIRTALYDVFGQHIQNLSNTEAKDIGPGPATLNGQWRARENDATELLTTVSYVARVRLDDGSQWIFNTDNLQLALSTLNLEQEIGEEEEEE